MRIKLGNGENTSFWEDCWIEGDSLRNHFPRLYNLESCKWITVGEKMRQPSLEFSFRRNTRGGVEQEQLGDLVKLMHDVSLSPMADRWTWALENSGEFTVSSVRKHIDDKLIPGVGSKTRWIKRHRGICFFSCNMVRQTTRMITRWWDVSYEDFVDYDDRRTWIINLRLPSKNKMMLEGAPVAWPLGFRLWERALYDSDSAYHYLSNPTPDEVKINILSALRTLSLSGQQYVLVHYWAATKSGKAYLLTTTDQPFGLYGNDKGLELYREGCLQHKLYIHPDENVAFGLPGYVFKCGTFLQTQNLHSCPGDQHPPCEAAIFDQIWGAFAVPVILANKRFGVLEFVMNTPKDSYFNDSCEVYKALEFAGFQPSTNIDPPRRTFTPPTRDRITESSKYDNYGCLARYMGLSKSEAMKRVTSRYNISMPAKGTFSSAHKTAGIPEWPWVRNTATRAYSPLETIINPIPFEIATEVEPQDAHPVDDTGEWELVDSDPLLQDAELTDAHPIDDIHEWEKIDIESVLQDLDFSTNQLDDDNNEMEYQHIEDASNQPLVGTHINQTHVTREDAGFSEWSRMDMPDAGDSAYEVMPDLVEDGKLMEVDTVFSLKE
uniref:Uncharacterized protein n=1 Tax=Tanacetum cinerariifolium TaxID=118510 RepID=A0A6L2NWR7_TANCI|nr:hypothetical protein [Tanacetum cinerariifolium]